MSAALPAVLVEAFSEGPGGGNGAAVVHLAAAVPDAWMQSVAASLRQSETAFLLRHGDGWLLRWFTPACEVPLCGHATLAALLALEHWGLLTHHQPLGFRSRSGLLRVGLSDRSGWGWLELPGGELQPADPPGHLQTLLRQRLASACSAFWRSALGYAVALVPPQAPLQRLDALAPALDPALRNGLVVMQAIEGPAAAGDAAEPRQTPLLAGEPADYQLRFFAPGLGIEEDPVTGSAHALVAAWWMERLGRPRVVGWQCSYRPGGMVCEASSSGTIRLTGSGHLLWDGSLRANPPTCSPDSSESATWRSLACGG
ncbi:MAG: PhzF family phenazine biosynthesis protein [Cyanobium sp.]